MTSGSSVLAALVMAASILSAGAELTLLVVPVAILFAVFSIVEWMVS